MDKIREIAKELFIDAIDALVVAQCSFDWASQLKPVLVVNIYLKVVADILGRSDTRSL